MARGLSGARRAASEHTRVLITPGEPGSGAFPIGTRLPPDASGGQPGTSPPRSRLAVTLLWEQADEVILVKDDRP